MHNKNLEGRWGNSLPGELVSYMVTTEGMIVHVCPCQRGASCVAGVLGVLEVMQELGLSGDVLV